MTNQPTDQDIARTRGISTAQVQLLHQERGMTNEALSKISDGTLRRSIRRLDYPDMPRAREAFRLLQARGESGRIPPDATVTALRELDSLRSRTATRPRIAGMPTGPTVAPRLLAATLTAGLQQSSWIAIGPGNIGGRTRSIVVHPKQPDTIWVGSVGGGVWRTDDGGGSWEPVDDLMANLAVTCMVMDPKNPNIIYAGTGEGFSNLDAIRGAGIFRTTDGRTWNHLPATTGPNFQAINRLAISRSARVLLVATPKGLFRSIDKDRVNWSLTLPAALADVKFHPTLSTRAVAGTLDGQAYYTTNSGATWKLATHASPWGGRVELAYARHNPAIVYASVEMNSGVIWRSTDGGRSYTPRTTLDPSGAPAAYLGDQGWYDNVIWAGDPTNADFVIAGGIDLWRSTDGGNTLIDISTWWDPRSAHADQHAIVAHPAYNGTTNRTVFFGNDGGIYKANDIRTVGNDPDLPRIGGWIELNNSYSVTQFYSGAGNPTTGTIIGGAQDNGTLCFKPSGGSERWTSIFGGDGGWCAADPTNPNVFYGEYVFLNIHRNMDGGASDDTQGDRYISGQFWNQIRGEWDWKPSPFRIPDAKNRQALFIAPFILDPNQPNRMLAGGASLWRTNDVKTPNTDTSGPRWASIKGSIGSFISAIAIAPGNSDIIWVGYDKGAVHKTVNGTANAPIWQQLNVLGPNPPMAPRYCSGITIDPKNAQNVFVTFAAYQSGNVWRTNDGGATWHDISGALPSIPIRALAIHPRKPKLLYLGTEVGVFASEDSGATWSPTNEGPTNCSVEDLFWMREMLVCVTHGRGMFTIDLSHV